MDLKLYYNCRDGIKDFLNFLFVLPNLKTIELFPNFPHVDQESHDEENYFFGEYQLKFERRGIQMTNHQ